jgi:cytochrome c-type biogenesis protein
VPALEQVIEQSWWLGIPGALFGGVLLALYPAALPMLGTVFVLGTTGELGSKGAGVRMAAAFGAGLVVVYTAVGFLAGHVDRLTRGFLQPYAGIWYLVLGALLVGLAVFVVLKPGSFCTACAKPVRSSPTLMGAFLFGIPGGLVNCPACAGIILGFAASSAAVGNPLYSAAIMFALGVGHAAMLTGFMWWAVGQRDIARLSRFLRPTGAVALAGLATYFIWLATINGLDPTQPRLV